MSGGREQLGRLVRRLRNQRWLGAIAGAVRAGLWVAAGALALGALARWRFGMPAPEILAAIATAPLIAALAWGIARRPAWSVVLADADRRAGADALLVTACGLPDAPRGTAALVMGQALRALPDWERRALRNADRHGVPMLPIAVLLATAPLLALQPAAGPAAPAATAVPGPGPQTASEQSLARVIAELRTAAPGVHPPQTGERVVPNPGTAPLARPAAEGPTAAAASDAEAAAPGALPGGALDPGGDAESAAPPSPGQRIAVGAGLGGPGRDVAGIGARSAGQQAIESRVDAPERRVGLARTAPSAGSTAAAGGELDLVGAGPPANAGIDRDAAPAEVPESGSLRTQVSGMAQRHLIARYFALRGNQAP